MFEKRRTTQPLTRTFSRFESFVLLPCDCNLCPNQFFCKNISIVVAHLINKYSHYWNLMRVNVCAIFVIKEAIKFTWYFYQHYLSIDLNTQHRVRLNF